LTVRTAITLREGADQAGFRAAVRALIAEDAAPETVIWQTAGLRSLFDAPPPAAAPPVPLSRDIAEMIRLVVCHRDAERFALLYQLIWRVRHGERALLEVHSDQLVHRLAMLAKAVRRDLHKMHAFLRFRRVPGVPDERYAAWFEPDHFILEETAQFFVDRFGALVWSILTPIGSLHWDGTELRQGLAGTRGDVSADDEFEEAWAGYYASTFNPARLNTGLMRQHMPNKYWRNMPEAELIPELVRNAASRVDTLMRTAPEASRKKDPVKAVAGRGEADPRTLKALNDIIAASEPFVEGGTRAVLGEGPLHPVLAFVGEQPGDQEDTEGHPFVGPAGQLLDKAMQAAGIDRGETYVTNAVKHFKFVQRGKRRLHQKPTMGEVKRYRWWLDKEIQLVQPSLIVALGSTAALALAGKAVSVTRSRGPTEFDGRAGFITVHPSYLLRIPDAEAKRAAYAAFVADLQQARELAASIRSV
jgi:probable DNA metabolism protein